MVWVVLVRLMSVISEVSEVVCSIMIILLLYCGNARCMVEGSRMW